MLHSVTSNVVQIWRKGHQPHFETLDTDEGTFGLHLQAGSSIESTADTLAGKALLPDTGRMAKWLQTWLRAKLQAQPVVEETAETML